MTTELILMMVLVIGLTLFIAQTFRQNQLIAQLVNGPWLALSGMIENGVWEPPSRSYNKHPNQHARHLTVKP